MPCCATAVDACDPRSLYTPALPVPLQPQVPDSPKCPLTAVPPQHVSLTTEPAHPALPVPLQPQVPAPLPASEDAADLKVPAPCQICLRHRCSALTSSSFIVVPLPCCATAAYVLTSSVGGTASAQPCCPSPLLVYLEAYNQAPGPSHTHLHSTAAQIATPLQGGKAGAAFLLHAAFGQMHYHSSHPSRTLRPVARTNAPHISLPPPSAL